MSGVTMRDSSGIVIVEHEPAALARAPEWTVAAEPSLDIGGESTEPGYDLLYVKSVARNGSAEFVVANGGTHEIRIFDARGRHVRTIGGRGAGPGEFSSLGWALLGQGDSILVYDAGLRRLNVFGPTGTLCRTVELSASKIGYRPPLGITASSVIVVPGTPRWNHANTGVFVDSIALQRVSAHAGDTLHGLGPYLAGSTFYLSEGGGWGVGEPLAFGPRLEAALGDFVIYLGYTNQSAIQGITDDGTLRRIIRWGAESVAVTEAMSRAYSERRLQGYREGSDRARFRKLHDIMPFPAVLPKFGELAVDSEQHLWVRDYPVHPDSNAPWSVFDPSGRLRARVRTPRGLNVMLIQRDEVVGIWKDDVDIEHLRAYALRRGT